MTERRTHLPRDRMAAIAHEIGTPMTAILGYAELLGKSVGDEKNRKRAAIIVEQVHRVRELTERLLELSRSRAGSREAVALDDLLDSALEACREPLEERGVALERQIGPVPQVLADRQRLRHVLEQLLLDAVLAAEADEVLRVSLARTERGEAEIRVCRELGGRSTVQFRLAFPPLPADAR